MIGSGEAGKGSLEAIFGIHIGWGYVVSFEKNFKKPIIVCLL
ncbi:MAG TPA: hypothetical protein VKF36_10420 [Syntrophorhabdales bacterium]|nr:hypothetical protein [Syntrophorhabdales bacterium]